MHDSCVLAGVQAYCRSDIHRKLCLGRLLQRELHNSSMQALVENGIQDEAQGKAAELAELQGLLRPPRSRKRRSSVVAEDEYMPKRRRGSTGGGIRVEEPVIEKEARWVFCMQLEPFACALAASLGMESSTGEPLILKELQAL